MNENEEQRVQLTQDADWAQIATWSDALLFTSRDPYEPPRELRLPNGDSCFDGDWVVRDRWGQFRVEKEAGAQR